MRAGRIQIVTDSYRLGVDVGGTFTDVLLIHEQSGALYAAKVPSTPEDSSRGVMHGVERVCALAGIDASAIAHLTHGTTVATNTILTASGARVGLVTTRGHRQILQIARSFVPGGLGAWVVYQRSEPLAPLELTIEADERIDARGQVVQALDEAALRAALTRLAREGVEALTVSLINAYANDLHERRVRDIAREVLPDIPISLSSEVIPEMQEYERTVTTVANAYVRPRFARYIDNLATEVARRAPRAKLSILRSDGGLASAAAAARLPVKHLMSGPAGGVSGAIWLAGVAGHRNLLTLDMGGTSTDVALIEDGRARLRRETMVGDVAVRAPSIDVRTVGAGGGSIAHVPNLTRALRVGPQSAGAAPGPAAYGRGGELPTVTDANVVLGYLPTAARLGGEMGLDVARARAAVQTIADALGLGLEAAAEGIYQIANEHMFGALRLVSVEQGYDPRDFALIAFGGAGPLHANALGRLMGSWPVIVPPGPGVLCAYGDATTRQRDEASRTFIRRFHDTSAQEVAAGLAELAEQARAALRAEGVDDAAQTLAYQLDLRYQGQGLMLSIDLEADELDDVLTLAGARFDALHEQLFTFALPVAKELVNLRAVALGPAPTVRLPTVPVRADVDAARYAEQRIHVEGRAHIAPVYDRARLGAGGVIAGPAIVTEMDATTLVLPGHSGRVDPHGNILITPDA
ncbi:MAG: hydantoinase/oxoprolinase family protein [Gammaproteobacteria bacterium]|nr:hydantoinase/oxoprolinase family protein [Gammaproteobacteria bacterium]